MFTFPGLLARSHPRPTPFAPPVILAHNARADLHTLLRAHSTPQSLALRARLVLRSADGDRPSTLHISRELGCANHTVGKWRRRDRDQGFSGLQDAVRPGRPKIIAPPTRVHVISVASTLPQEQDRPVTRWSLAELVTAVLETLHTAPISRASIWRLLHEVDLKPHKSASWLNSHDEDFEGKAHTLGQLDVPALEAYEHGRLVLCCEAKTGRQVLERTAPPKPARPGQRERRAHEDMRPGPRVLINSLVVATGQMAWTLGRPRTATDCVAHLQHVSQRLPRRQQ